jgi:hypothetical protein
MAANWDPRRFHAPYAERFVESLAVHAKRHLSGEFRHAPPVPLPSEIQDLGGEPATRSTRRRPPVQAR